MIRFFDLDNTICESRQKISPEMKSKLSELEPFIVISGASKQRIEYQMDGLPCILMGQNGNDAPDWQNKLSQRDVKEIFNHIHKIYPYFPDDCIQNRGCQMSLSFIGHSADIKDKKKFDPRKRLRYKVLKQIPFRSKTLTCRVAGTTCFDYNKKGHLKGDNITRYIKYHKLNPKDCVYYGDNFTKGGNDESVLGVIKCIRVKNPDDLLKKL
jgi:HAD superfamily hydrolase (TIGR01484 family)